MRRPVFLGVAGLSLALWVAADADVASARARFGGSRGGRSFSAPSRPAPHPSLPSVPSSPSRSLAEPRSPAAPALPSAPRPSFFGSVASSAAGFVVGGLVGRMLFGVSAARPAFGLGELVLFGVAAYLVFTLFRQRGPTARPVLAPAGAPAISVPTGNRGPEPSLDRNALADGARAMYAGIQSALVMQDMGMFRSRLAPALYATLQAECDRMRHAKQSRHVEKIDVEHADVSEAWQKDGYECARVRLAGSLVEHTTDDARGTTLAGADASPRPFEEYWTFTRPAGSTAWRLAAIQAA